MWGGRKNQKTEVVDGHALREMKMDGYIPPFLHCTLKPIRTKMAKTSEGGVQVQGPWSASVRTLVC